LKNPGIRHRAAAVFWLTALLAGCGLNPPPNGTGVFLDGWYAFIDRMDCLSELREQGYNSVLIYTTFESGSQTEYAGDDRVETAMDACSDTGLKAVLEIKRPALFSDDFAEIGNYVGKFKDHPSLAAWYLMDEPEVPFQMPDGASRVVSPATMGAAYSSIRGESPNIPVYVVFSPAIDVIGSYDASFDLVGVNFYPCSPTYQEFGKMVGFAPFHEYSRLYAERNGKEGFIPVIQGDGLRSRDEYRYMAYSCLIRKPKGLLTWMYSVSNEDTKKNIIYPVHAEYLPLIPFIQNGEFMSASVTVGHEAIKYNFSEGCLIAVNESNGPVSTRIAFAKAISPQMIPVLSEHRWIACNGKSFSDDFSPFGVHVYRFRR
jgi:hypothetical protein